VSGRSSGCDRRATGIVDGVSTFPKSAVEQTVEIESLVSEALEVLDHIRYSLKTLEDRLKAAQAQAAARAQARSSAAPADAPPADAPPADATPADATPADGAV
jgi:uncharacterized coiled-coil protein SlyX